MKTGTFVFLAVAAMAALSACTRQPYAYGPGMMRWYQTGPAVYGPGMMGPGMMAPFGDSGMMTARAQACNADGSVPDHAFRANPGTLQLSPDDITKRIESALAWNGNPNLKLGTVRESGPDTVAADLVTKENSLIERVVFDRRTGFSCIDLAAK